MMLAAKCAPQREILQEIQAAGIQAVELYLSEEIMRDVGKIIALCREFPFCYAVHAPNDCYKPDALLTLTGAIGAQVVVFHDIFWSEEWEAIARFFKDSKTKVCVENIGGIHEPLKLMRRFGFGRCLDLEHLQMQCNGVHEEEFKHIFKEASHVHLTGYCFGSKLWHTHIHASARHNRRFLTLLREAGYNGMVVSEAGVSLQTRHEFRRLKRFYEQWEKI